MCNIILNGKILRLRNLAWGCSGVNFWSGNIFCVLIFAPFSQLWSNPLRALRLVFSCDRVRAISGVVGVK